MRRIQDEPNRLILTLAGTKATLTSEQWRGILDHISYAGFASRQVNVDKEILGIVFDGQPLRSRESSARAHLAKRVLVDRQWPQGATEEQYVEDLKSILDAPDLRKVVYRGGDGQVVLGLLGYNRLPPERLG